MNNTREQMTLIIGGVLVMVIGIVLADVIIDTTATALTNASIGSFAGAESVGGLLPLIYFTVVILIGVGLMGIGARGLVRVAWLPVAAVLTPYPMAFVLASAVALYAVYYIQRRRSFRQLAEARE